MFPQPKYKHFIVKSPLPFLQEVLHKYLQTISINSETKRHRRTTNAKLTTWSPSHLATTLWCLGILSTWIIKHFKRKPSQTCRSTISFLHPATLSGHKLLKLHTWNSCFTAKIVRLSLLNISVDPMHLW